MENLDVLNELEFEDSISRELNELKEDVKKGGPKLTKSAGTVEGPSGKETWYNLPMDRVVIYMKPYGFSKNDYWVRDDGVKMLGNYVMVAADFKIRPRGTILATSLGEGIVCDTGSFTKKNPTQLDIAVNWKVSKGKKKK